ncbi:ACP S-malonyltransferase [Fusobacterium perfoetens]|uniref:ACP S-malonyltransferase n=1 Tax=Fusobacterium perfoetens TaxID=852 RepID=UPI0015A16317|nr:ACP S-malonyltransferase [Fusobacterium perfoetens]MCF2625958.1 ACP S-malonyltransferase [Fusobacterium perfoetens]
MGKTAFVFPGQGAQFVGMGKDIYENNEIAKQEFDKIFSSLSFDLKTAMFEGPEETLKKTKYTQPAIVAMSLVLEKLVREKGIKPDFVAGHSVGEYAAFGSGEFLTLSDAVKLTAFRGETMNEIAESVNGGMAAIIGMESSKIEEVLKTVEGVVEAVNFNEPKQTVIAGQKDAIERACVALKEAGAKRALPLAVSGPFHSSLMKPAGEKLKSEAEKYDFKEGTAKLIANTTAEIISTPAEIKAEIYAQSFGPVKWVDTVNKLKENGVDTIYEIGPGKVLAGLIKKIDKELTVINVNSLDDIEKL